MIYDQLVEVLERNGKKIEDINVVFAYAEGILNKEGLINLFKKYEKFGKNFIEDNGIIEIIFYDNSVVHINTFNDKLDIQYQKSLELNEPKIEKYIFQEWYMTK